MIASGRSSGSFGRVGQPLDQPDHVVADHAEQARGHRRQAGGDVEPRRRDEVAQGVQRVAGLAVKGAARDVGRRPRSGPARPWHSPDQVRVHHDHRIAPAPGAALDRLEQEGVGPAARDLEIGRNRRFQIVDQAGPDHLRAAAVVDAREMRERRLESHLAAHFAWAALRSGRGIDADRLARQGDIDLGLDLAPRRGLGGFENVCEIALRPAALGWRWSTWAIWVASPGRTASSLAI